MILPVFDLFQGRRTIPIDDDLRAPQGRKARPREEDMDFEKYTDRARGFVQSAQSLAQREGHQQFSPDHLLKVLLDDPEGLAAGLIDRSGGNSREALQAVEAALAKRPKVSGGGAGQVYLDPALARDLRHTRRRSPRRPATASSPSSGCCSRSRSTRRATPGKSWRARASRRRTSTPPSRRCARAAPPTRLRPRTPMTRSRNTPAT